MIPNRSIVHSVFPDPHPKPALFKVYFRSGNAKCIDYFLTLKTWVLLPSVFQTFWPKDMILNYLGSDSLYHPVLYMNLPCA